MEKKYTSEVWEMTIKELYESIGGNYDSALRIMQMDRLIDRFIRKFLNEETFGKLVDAYEAQDGTGIFESSHAMKGVSANLGLDKLSAIAGEIADEFRPGRERKMDDAALAAKMDELKVLYNKTQDGIRLYTEQ